MLGMSRMLLFAAIATLLGLLALVALLVSCRGGSGSGEATATEQPQATATVRPAETPDIRSEALTEQPGLSEFLAATGGVAESSRIMYADLTGSGADEAIVPVSSGGEGGDIAIFVFGYDADGELEELLRAIPAESSIVATLDNRQLKTTEGVRAPGDVGVPSQVLHRYYIWDGSALVVEREEQEPA